MGKKEKKSWERAQPPRKEKLEEGKIVFQSDYRLKQEQVEPFLFHSLVIRHLA